MSTQADGAKRRVPGWAWLLAGVVVTLLANFLLSTQKGPAFERVSGAGAYLTQVKTVGESLGRQARSDTRVTAAERETGRELYLAVRTETDGLITWLQTGLARRFNARGDVEEYESRLRRTDTAVKAFVAWANTALPRVFGAAGGGTDALSDIGEKLIDAARETDEKMIERLRLDLEKCRLQDWDKLSS